MSVLQYFTWEEMERLVCGKKIVDIDIKNNYKFEKLEPWGADIISIKLVSKEELIKTLKKYKKPTEHKADYYYLVKARKNYQSSEGVVAISTEENSIISPFSPKIVQLYDGNNNLL